MNFSTDIDIDFKDRLDACTIIPHVPASMMQKNEMVRHPSGIYIQDIPVHPLLDCSSLTTDRAEAFGYFKIDFLSNSVYEGIRDKNHLKELMAREVPWAFFLDPGIVSRLAHIHGHFNIVSYIRPKSIEDLAVVLALMRPGKRHLCYRPREEVDAEIWVKQVDGYTFKHSHAVSYAVSITVQLQLLIERIGREIDDKKGDDVFTFSH